MQESQNEGINLNFVGRALLTKTVLSICLFVYLFVQHFSLVSYPPPSRCNHSRQHFGKSVSNSERRLVLNHPYIRGFVKIDVIAMQWQMPKIRQYFEVLWSYNRWRKKRFTLFFLCQQQKASCLLSQYISASKHFLMRPSLAKPRSSTRQKSRGKEEEGRKDKTLKQPSEGLGWCQGDTRVCLGRHQGGAKHNARGMLGC